MIIPINNFLDKNSFLWLTDYARNTDRWEPANTPLWNNRCINLSNIEVPEVIGALENLYAGIKDKIVQNLKPTGPIYPELLQIVRSPVADTNPPHSDSTGNDGEDNGTGFRVFSSILYLNREFSGGELYFPNQKTTITPEPNLLVIFPATFEYMHGVQAITDGMRYTVTSFWTYEQERDTTVGIFNV